MKRKEATPRSFSFIEPMKALPVEKLPEADWLYEVKFDDTGHWPSRTARMCGWSHAIKRTSITLNCLML
jgi:hypothetical protein